MTISSSAEKGLGPRETWQLLMRHKRRWLIPTLGITLVGITYALVRQNTWEASQALIIRQEATVQPQGPGRFGDLAQMQTVQETIVELARSKGVLRAALTQVGPPSGYSNPSRFPTERDIASLRERLKISPPHGQEFGKTEVFYLKIKDSAPKRAIGLVSAVCRELEEEFRLLRNARFQSMAAELAKAETLAQNDLNQTVTRLAEMETQVGIDLGELRMLNTSTTATSDLRQKLVEVQNELRRSQTDKLRNEQLHKLLEEAVDDPGRLLAMPGSLLESQPALRRLKDALVDAQLNTATLQGTMAETHPLVQAAKTAQMEINQRLHGELTTAIKGIEADLRLHEQRIADLQAQLTADGERLEQLATLRAQYDSLLASATNRTQLLEAARRNLADTRANQAATDVVSLISRIDDPDTGVYPLGPSKTMIAAASLLGGWFIGLGIVFLTAEVVPGPRSSSRSNGTRKQTTSLSDVKTDQESSYQESRWAVPA